MLLLRFTGKVSCAHKRMGKIIVSFLLIFTFLIEEEKTKDCERNEEHSYISTPKEDEHFISALSSFRRS
jgi:hypothetical protein